MSLAFYKVKVSEVRRETASCVSLVFSLPPDLVEKFDYKPGQHVIIKSIDEAGQEIRRNYSICAAPKKEPLRVAVKKIDGGYFSSFVNDQLKVGDELEISNPQGNFCLEANPAHSKVYVAIAAGSGITPVLAMIKTVLHEEPKSKFFLLYGNKNKRSIIFKDELDALKNQYLDRFSVFHVLSQEEMENDFLQGRIDGDKINKLIKSVLNNVRIDEVFLCGPEGMIETSKIAFKNAGLAPDQIHFELFYHQPIEKGSGNSQGARAEYSGQISEVQVILDGITHKFSLPYDGDSILEAALKQGADLPFSCKGGVCATCKCKIEKGEVHMDVNYALEPDELERGYILSCQSHPISPVVIVNYDAK
jgi:ring-1,2-phenylacetyl-CoA epoxidase subunit PaaE